MAEYFEYVIYKLLGRNNSDLNFDVSLAKDNLQKLTQNESLVS